LEIREFAEAVLFSADMDLKLAPPERMTDRNPGAAVAAPAAPGRPTWLPLRSSRSIPDAPTPAGLVNERVRGLALHSFAHHELQALELMALALLRFPDAPQGFRRGLVKILGDEQRHFRMYTDRAEHWGVGLGEVGTGHFFWDTVANLDTPADFLAALSLTYEQANLDFSSHWEDAFRAVDDPVSADVLNQVYEDEIAHVRHGVAWFDRLNGGIQFEDYARRLVFPLSPGRAKGPIFDREGRVRAGLSEAFIDEMEITNVSRGRPPRVFHFDPFVEERAAGRTPSQATAFVARDLASVMMFLAHREDVVIAQRPRLSVLRDLHRLGVEIPQFVPSRAELGERLLGAEAPWGTVEQVRRVDKVESLRIRKAVLDAVQGPLWAHCLGRVCRELADAPVGENFIAKSPLSASGQHRVHLEAPTATAWLERRLRQGPVVIEPWYERVADVSLQLDIGEDEARNLGVTRFWTAGSGAYRGAVLGPWSAGMDADALRGLHGGGKGSLINDGLADVGRLVGAELHAMGIRGPVGVDCMVVKQDGAIRFLPVLEVNPRFTMGRVALELHRSTGLRGGWFIVDDAAVMAAGHTDRASFIAAVEGNAAAVFTTDPWSAERVLTVMVGAKNTAVAKASWESLGFDWPD
jgi:uncharacterized ferritin-like protein (DUF455 family)